MSVFLNSVAFCEREGRNVLKNPKFVLPLATLALFVGFPVTAHHSGSTYFDLDAEIVHTNVTVVSYNLVNPHGRLVYAFTDADGNEEEWSGELASSNNMRRRGLGGEILLQLLGERCSRGPRQHLSWLLLLASGIKSPLLFQVRTQPFIYFRVLDIYP